MVLKNFCVGLGIGVLQIRRPEGVRRNALRVLCPNYPHSEEVAQYIEQKRAHL